MKAVMFYILLMFTAQPLSADPGHIGTIPFRNFFESVSAELDIAPSSILAIAQVESCFNPWSLNIEGRTYRFSSKAEALAKATEAWHEGRSFDVGIMQVNRWWLDRYNISLEAAFDPLANIYFGGWILKQELARHKNLRAAIGAYHSPDPLRANRYANQVMKALAGGPAKASNGHSPAKAATGRPAKAKAESFSRPISPAATTLKVSFNLEQSMKVRKK